MPQHLARSASLYTLCNDFYEVVVSYVPESRRSCSSSVNVSSEVGARHVGEVENALWQSQDGTLELASVADLRRNLDRRGKRAEARTVRNIMRKRKEREGGGECHRDGGGTLPALLSDTLNITCLGLGCTKS